MDKRTYGKHGVEHTNPKDNNGFSLLEPVPTNSSSPAGVINVRSMRLPPLSSTPAPLTAMKLPPIGPPQTMSTGSSTSSMPLAPMQPPPIQPPERILSPGGPEKYERIVVNNGTITTEPPQSMGWKPPSDSGQETKSFTQSISTKLTTYPASANGASPLPAISEPPKKPSSSLQVNSRRKPSSYRVAFKCFFICLFLSIPIVIFIIMMALSGGFNPSNGTLSNLSNSTSNNPTGSVLSGNNILPPNGGIASNGGSDIVSPGGKTGIHTETENLLTT